jgi:PTH1 family peptidyl-tRNA hydrolase
MTRHNAGFATVDALARRCGVTYWKSQAGCEVASVTIAGKTITLAKPQSYMNTSGGPLSKLMRELRVEPAELLVIHDEVDLPAGEIRDKFGGGLNAHNGLRSIKGKLGTPDFWRLRVGIGRPPGKMSVADWALRKLKGDFAEDFLVTCETAADAAERLVAQD